MSLHSMHIFYTIEVCGQVYSPSGLFISSCECSVIYYLFFGLSASHFIIVIHVRITRSCFYKSCIFKLNLRCAFSLLWCLTFSSSKMKCWYLALAFDHFTDVLLHIHLRYIGFWSNNTDVIFSFFKFS